MGCGMGLECGTWMCGPQYRTEQNGSGRNGTGKAMGKGMGNISKTTYNFKSSLNCLFPLKLLEMCLKWFQAIQAIQDEILQ
jgi:hypothetical protein